METSSLRRRPLVVAIVGALALAGCGGAADRAPEAGGAPGFPMQVDNCGQTVTLARPPTRIVTSGTQPVNLLTSVGAADRIVGRSGESGQPLPAPDADAVADVPVLTPDRPTAEIVIGSGPDLLYADPPGLPELRPQLETAGVTVMSTCNDDTYPEVWATLELLGRIMGTEARSRTVVQDLRQRVATVEADRPGRGRSAVAVSVYQNTLYADGSRAMKHSMMTTLGLRNVFASLDRETFEVNVEELIAADPEVIVLAYGSNGESFDYARRLLTTTAGLERLQALRTGTIVGIRFTEAYGTPSGVGGLEKLAGALRALP